MSKAMHILPMKSWIYTGVLLISILLLGVLSESYANFSGDHQLTTINVYGHRIMSRDRLEGMLAQYYGAALLDIDTDAIRDEFMAYPLVRSAKITRTYPDQMDIYLRELVPVAYISLGRVLTLDGDATLLPLPDNGMLYNLPIITRLPEGLAAAKVGTQLEHSTIRARVHFLSEIRQSYPGIYLDISEISYDDNAGVKLISAAHSTAVILGDWDRVPTSMAVLDAFLEGESDEQTIEPYQYIDLRFANQVIVKER